MRYINSIQLKSKIDNQDSLIVVDVREPYELEICKIDSLHIPMAEVPSRLSEIPKKEDIIILCRSGKRAVAVANMLETDFNIANVSVLEGGILDWIDKIDNQLEAY